VGVVDDMMVVDVAVLLGWVEKGMNRSRGKV
jgi:hypothetical protein